MNIYRRRVRIDYGLGSTTWWQFAFLGENDANLPEEIQSGEKKEKEEKKKKKRAYFPASIFFYIFMCSLSTFHVCTAVSFFSSPKDGSRRECNLSGPL